MKDEIIKREASIHWSVAENMALMKKFRIEWPSLLKLTGASSTEITHQYNSGVKKGSCNSSTLEVVLETKEVACVPNEGAIQCVFSKMYMQKYFQDGSHTHTYVSVCVYIYIYKKSRMIISKPKRI